MRIIVECERILLERPAKIAALVKDESGARVDDAGGGDIGFRFRVISANGIQPAAAGQRVGELRINRQRSGIVGQRLVEGVALSGLK